jgi:predicted RNA-binding protein associated with RNAse of E/G family
MGGTPYVEPPEIPVRRSPGETVALREIWAGRVWYARPAVVVSDQENLQVFHIPAHVHCKQPVSPDGTPLRIPADTWRLEDEERGDTRILSFAFADTPYAVILPFDPDGRLGEYYVNLQSPLRRSVAGFDTVEHLLDVRIAPDRSRWTWKDEDELEIAVHPGLFTTEDAAWFRHWGERAVEHVLLREPPFDDDWATWRPDPAWDAIDLPDVWDAQPA